MKILLIGGTRFIGRHLVEQALKRGDTLTLFNRGRTNPGLFPGVEQIRGDRERDLDRLSGRAWDLVVDTCGYYPRLVEMSARHLSDSVACYLFISTISVYSDFSRPGMDEDGPLGSLADETVEEITNESYGPLKVLCERAVQRVYEERALIVRPGLVVGPHDPSDRFTYWPVRVGRGGEVLAPDRPEAPLQFIDVRDLAAFLLTLADRKTRGVFHATGQPLGMGTLLNACKQVSGSSAVFRWASVEFLEEHSVIPWVDLPAWSPDRGEEAGAALLDISRALGAGLELRPLEDTVRDTLQWAGTRPPDHVWKNGLSPEREQELLKALG